MSKPFISLDQRFSPTIYSYDSGCGHKNVLLNGISEQIKGQYTVSINSATSRFQTVLLEQGDDWEIVIELRPRKFSQLELSKVK